ncbi:MULTISPECIES: transcription elongation factor GreA [Candidatus Ichthyocystis]|uniref:transcription elongation factor GreA n=1 Tax=Candidatus Ichthyocystis TaxID=2929841 RepID=UPI000B33FA7D|nr:MULTISPECIES: transcription elongation factor GreA [Ichthyocystis]
MKRFPITKRGAEELEKELYRLKYVERPSVILALQEARAHGDLSENAEYEAAKERQGFVEGRIQEIMLKLSMAEVIDPSAIKCEECVFGSTVTLLDLDTEEKVQYQIVGEDEADLKNGKISINSPLARALIGKHVGSTAEVEAPAGIRSYDILAIEYI